MAAAGLKSRARLKKKQWKVQPDQQTKRRIQVESTSKGMSDPSRGVGSCVKVHNTEDKTNEDNEYSETSPDTSDVPINDKRDFLFDVHRSSQEEPVLAPDEEDDLIALDLSQLAQSTHNSSPIQSIVQPVNTPFVASLPSTTPAGLLNASDDEDAFVSSKFHPRLEKETLMTDEALHSLSKSQDFGLRDAARTNYCESSDSDKKSSGEDSDYESRQQKKGPRKRYPPNSLIGKSTELAKKRKLHEKKTKDAIEAKHEVPNHRLAALDFTLDDVEKELQGQNNLGSQSHPQSPYFHPSPSDVVCPACGEGIQRFFWNRERRRTFEKMKKCSEEQLFNEFCDLHSRFNRVYSNGIHSGYPNKINAKSIRKRIRKLQKELLELIQGNRYSVFKEKCLKTYRQLGRKAKSNMYKLERFRSSQCGYYGRYGGLIILRELKSMFASEEQPLLTSHLCKPMAVLEYLQDVLVPEAAARLIVEDRDITLDMALEVMRESSEYGQLVFDQSSGDEI